MGCRVPDLVCRGCVLAFGLGALSSGGGGGGGGCGLVGGAGLERGDGPLGEEAVDLEEGAVVGEVGFGGVGVCGDDVGEGGEAGGDEVEELAEGGGGEGREVSAGGGCV